MKMINIVSIVICACLVFLGVGQTMVYALMVSENIIPELTYLKAFAPLMFETTLGLLIMGITLLTTYLIKRHLKKRGI